MIVLRETFEDVLHALSKSSIFSTDTETTGLFPFRGDRLFSAIIYDGSIPYYFNFIDYPGIEPGCVLPYAKLKDLNALTQRADTLWFLHNAKFDMHFYQKEGVNFGGDIHDTEVGARVEFNDHMEYSLEECAARIGEKKDDAVMEYLKKNKLYSLVEIPGKKAKFKNYFFSKVPLSLIQPYGEKDAVVTYRLGIQQINALKQIANTAPPGHRTVLDVMANEVQLTKTCAKIERTGIKIDREYCVAAAEYEKKNYELAAEKFSDMSGIKFVDSAKCFVPAFEKLGEAIPLTDKGNPSFTDDVLAKFKSPLAKVVQEYRAAHMRCNTYFRSFLYHADENDLIHANIRQSGTKTGRFSYSDPNLQNLPKEDEGDPKFPVRRAFVPRPGRFFVMIDFNQQEFRLMLDYALQMNLIDAIKAGHDPHEATAELVRALGAHCTRKMAKTINFGIVYGMGAATLADALGIGVEEAKEFRREYFRALPNVKETIYGATQTAETRTFVVGWLGRRFHFLDPRFAYRAFNAIDQGSCADIIKVAMNRIDVFLERKNTRMLLQVHDELVFESVIDELPEVEICKHIMETVYVPRALPLTCSVEHSFASMYDKIKGLPDCRKEILEICAKDKDLLAVDRRNYH